MSEPINKTCENCIHFRIKSDNFGICDNEQNQTKAMSVNLIKALTDCEDDIADEINQSVRFHKDFGCRFWTPYPNE